MRFLKITILVIFIAFSAACWWFSAKKNAPVKIHHAQTLRKATAENVKGDFERENHYESSGARAEMKRIGNDFFIIFENRGTYKIEAVIGTKKLEEYLARKDGKFVRLPVAYDLIQKRWLNLNSTFFEADGADFFKYQTDWETNCAACHLETSAQNIPTDCATCHSKTPHESEAIQLSSREHHGILRSVCFVKNKGGEVINCLSCHSSENPSKQDEKILSQTACTDCHQQFSSPEAIFEHTKHQINSANCYSCHMPEIAYGHLRFQRTHAIGIPNPELTAKNQTPNACNLCHTDKSVNWAISESKRFWSEHFREAKISTDEQFDQPEVIRTLFAGNAFSRALAAESLTKHAAPHWFAPFAIEALEDEKYGIVRCFLENALGENRNFHINHDEQKRAKDIARKLQLKRKSPDLQIPE